MNDLIRLSPILIVIAVGLALLVLDLFRAPTAQRSSHLPWLTVIGLCGALAETAALWGTGPGLLEHPALIGVAVVDSFTLFFWAFLLVATICTALLSAGFDADNNLDCGEYYSFLAFACAGMMVMAAACDLLLLFVALETMSLAVYVLAAMKRDSARAAEGALKYFFNGAVASAILLYGLAILWGEAGTLKLAGLAAFVAGGGAAAPLLYVAASLVCVGFCFKLALVPFHMWVPDAYQGAPTPVAGFMAAGVKAAAAAAFLRLTYAAMLPELFSSNAFSFVDVVIGVSVLTMIVGNLVALFQDDPKRMLAYSSIAHAGYLLAGFVLVPTLGSGRGELRFANGAILFYLVAYGLATLLAFGALAALGKDGHEETGRDRLNGLAHRRPALAFLLSLSLFSLAGFPPLAGFFAKFGLFRELIVLSRGKLTPLVVIAVITTLVSVVYYLKPVVAMYMKEAEGEEPSELRSPSAALAMLLLAASLLLLGLLPGRLAALSAEAGRTVAYEKAQGLSEGDYGALAPFAHKERPPEK
jgi:NADH-quinone oxidoreductase subunit N